MADTRTLKLSLLADVNKFLDGMDNADKKTKGFSSGIGKYSKAMAKSFALAGAAAGAYAIKLGVDGVKAAVEDELSQKKLAQALKNTTGATDDQIASTEDYIKKQQLLFGVADTDLRPALANLARATGDLTEAQNLNNLAIDIAAATGKNLEIVSLGLSRAYNGNLGALTKLGVPLDENIIKTKDFDAAVETLTATFGGSAKANTETFAGQLAILQQYFGEIQEDIGAKLIPKLKLLLENVNLVAKGFSGEDPDGLSARARELQNYTGNTGPTSLGGSLNLLATNFAKLFTALTSTSSTNSISTLDRIATSLETFANAIDSVTNAYKSYKSFYDKVPQPLREFFNPFSRIGDYLSFAGGKAAGGSVMGNQVARVGEFGPELFVPNGVSGSIRKDNGGSGNTFIFNGVIDGESARRSIERLLQNSAKRTAPINLVGSTFDNLRSKPDNLHR